MREIILMRHGRPILSRTGAVSPVEMKAWIEHYNHSVVETNRMPQSSIHLAATASHIVCSSAPRALSSLQALGLTPAVTDSIFSEAELPYSSLRFPRLSPTVWAACFRLLWLCGYARNSESFREAKTRAKSAARTLVLLAEQGTVLLMGHGVMNKLIAHELSALGWTGPRMQNNQYWAANIYRFEQ